MEYKKIKACKLFHAINHRIASSPFYKGIKNKLTKEQIELLWDRDNADSLKRPSIDRIDSSGDYEFKNCRFIEFSENVKRARAERTNKRSYDDLCKNGHKMDAENTHWYGSKKIYRVCKKCRHEKQKIYIEKNRKRITETYKKWFEKNKKLKNLKQKAYREKIKAIRQQGDE